MEDFLKSDNFAQIRIKEYFAFNYHQNRASMTHTKSLIELEQTGKYGSVVISNCGCNMSAKLSAQHFSFEHAPSLPLQGCTATKCTCEYRGVIDRRLEDRRVSNGNTCFDVKDDKRKSDRRK